MTWMIALHVQHQLISLAPLGQQQETSHENLLSFTHLKLTSRVNRNGRYHEHRTISDSSLRDLVFQKDAAPIMDSIDVTSSSEEQCTKRFPASCPWCARQIVKQSAME